MPGLGLQNTMMKSRSTYFLFACMSALLCVAQAEDVQLQIASEEACESLDFVPGYNLAGEGFDITTLASKTSNVIDMETYLDLGGKCKTFQNGQLEGKPQQKVPQAVSTWRMLHTGVQEIKYRIYSTAREFSQKSEDYTSNSWSIGLDADASGLAGFPPLAVGFLVKGSRSRLSQFTREEGSKEQSAFVELGVEFVLYEYSLVSNDIRFTEDFVTSLNKLPFQYVTEKDRFAFQAFFDEYGTHVINKVKLGGRIKALTVIRSCDLYRFQNTTEQVANSLSWEASLNIGIIHPGGGSSKNSTHNDWSHSGVHFSSVFTNRKYDITGGSAEGMADIFFSANNTDKFKKWVTSLSEKPGVVNYDTKPIFMMLLSAANTTKITNVKAKARVLKAATDAYLYATRKTAESEMCKDSCGYQCPFGGKANDDCGCECSADEFSDSKCCPKKSGLGTLVIKDLRMENLESADIITKVNGWIGTISPPLIYKQTSHTWGDSNPSWPDVWDMGDMIAGTEVCLFAEGKKGGAFKVDWTIVPSCCVRLDGTQKRQLFQCPPLFATAEFSCHKYYSGALCDRYDRDVINKPSAGNCIKPNLHLDKFICNETCAKATPIKLNVFYQLAIVTNNKDDADSGTNIVDDSDDHDNTNDDNVSYGADAQKPASSFSGLFALVLDVTLLALLVLVLVGTLGLVCRCFAQKRRKLKWESDIEGTPILKVDEKRQLRNENSC